MASDQHKVGLSLSGGGYRASAFHLGTLKKLHEMGILRRVDILSTLSGGSINGECYSLENEKPCVEFEQLR
jgi:NTE family protein